MNFWLFALPHLQTTVFDKTDNVSTIINTNLCYLFMLFICFVNKGKQKRAIIVFNFYCLFLGL